MGDDGDVRCIDCRTALSAEIDGETPSHSPEQVRAHLRECAECGVWLSAARGLHRLVGATLAAGSGGDELFGERPRG
ncbi:zf-HC2 domain-containing protein [Thermobifida cellulosilytica]|uniref:zf-HC2 domain-containing protein n=1 Tax=Thermobifida cellulosilytica TaxID=144786 RepID=UPI00373FCE0E